MLNHVTFPQPAFIQTGCPSSHPNTSIKNLTLTLIWPHSDLTSASSQVIPIHNKSKSVRANTNGQMNARMDAGTHEQTIQKHNASAAPTGDGGIKTAHYSYLEVTSNGTL